jgi:general secretion pathway protein F
MKQSGVFPPLAMHLVEVGEESGKLDAMLVEVANVYDVDVRTSIKRIISFFEPALILLMGLIIGTIVVSMLLAIFSINDITFLCDAAPGEATTGRGTCGDE